MVETEKQICSKDNILKENLDKSDHPDAIFVRSHGAWERGRSYDEYRCPHCNCWFKEYTN